MADISLLNLSKDSDNPKLARADLYEAITRVNAITRQFSFPSDISAILSGALTVQGITSLDVLNAVKINTNDLNLDNGSITSVSQTVNTTNPNQVIDSFDATAFRTAKYVAQITWGSNQHAIEIMLVHDGLNARMVQYGIIFTTNALASFDVDIVNGRVRLLTTPVNPNTSYKLIRTGVKS